MFRRCWAPSMDLEPEEDEVDYVIEDLIQQHTGEIFFILNEEAMTVNMGPAIIFLLFRFVEIK